MINEYNIDDYGITESDIVIDIWSSHRSIFFASVKIMY